MIRLGTDALLFLCERFITTDYTDALEYAEASRYGSTRTVVVTPHDGVTNVNALLNIIYRGLLASSWQMYPLMLVIALPDRLSVRFDMKQIIRGLEVMVNITLSSLFIPKSKSEVEAVFAKYPRFGVIWKDDDVWRAAVSNAFRERTLHLLANYNVLNGVHSTDLALVGWNDFEVMSSLELGFKPIIFDLYVKTFPHPFRKYNGLGDFKRLADTSKSLELSYPSDLHTRYMNALTWLYATGDVVMINVTPPSTLLCSKFNLMNRQHNGHATTLIDAAFRDPGLRRTKRNLKNLGFEIQTSTYHYNEKSISLFTSQKDLIIRDDIDVSDDRIQHFMKRLSHFEALIVKRNELHLSTKILMRLNPRFGRLDKSIKLDYLHDVILVPGAPRDGEVYLLLTSVLTNRSLTLSDYLFSVYEWRAIPLFQQVGLFSIYFHELYRNIDIFSHNLSDTPIIANFAMSSFTALGVDDKLRWKQLMYSRSSSQNIPSTLVTIPFDVTDLADMSEGNVNVLATSKRTYVDHVITFNYLLHLDACSVNPFGIMPLSGSTFKADLKGPMYGRENFKRVPKMLISGPILSMYLPQSAYGSPGPIIKCFTLALRTSKLLPNDFTYTLRLRLLQQITTLDRANVTTIATGDTTFISNVSQSVLITSGPMKGKSITLLAKEKVAVSGHLLNLLIATRFGIDIVKLWLLQWRSQTTSESQATLKRYFQDGVLFDYNPDGHEGISDPWHSRNDVILALAIAPDYMRSFDVEPLADDDLLYLLSLI